MFPASRALPAWLLAVLVLGVSLRAGAPSTRIPLHRTRSSPSDLEIGGDLSGVPAGETRFVRYADLLRLPQQIFVAKDDLNFGHPVRVTGVPLERLPALLGAAHGATMVTALCGDGYKANYPAAYLGVHHPVLLLRVNGQPPATWPRSSEGFFMGPYLISHAQFAPAFHVLSHADEPQVPWGVVRVDVRREAQVYGAIQPTGANAQQPSVQAGYAIARQNCFRCHNEGVEGGQKANRSWEVVARRSVADPMYFDGYVRNPKRDNPASQMASSPVYDAATLAALRAYLRPFAERPLE